MNKEDLRERLIEAIGLELKVQASQSIAPDVDIGKVADAVMNLMSEDTQLLNKLTSSFWNDGPETFIVIKAKDVQLGVQTYSGLILREVLREYTPKAMHGRRLWPKMVYEGGDLKYADGRDTKDKNGA